MQLRARFAPEAVHHDNRGLMAFKYSGVSHCRTLETFSTEKKKSFEMYKCCLWLEVKWCFMVSTPFLLANKCYCCTSVKMPNIENVLCNETAFLP